VAIADPSVFSEVGFSRGRDKKDQREENNSRLPAWLEKKKYYFTVLAREEKILYHRPG
jgi:hypothetical protein